VGHLLVLLLVVLALQTLVSAAVGVTVRQVLGRVTVGAAAAAEVLI
jgi:hypothetical protein